VNVPTRMLRGHSHLEARLEQQLRLAGGVLVLAEELEVVGTLEARA
jgi:hypothetical protein